MDNQRPDSINIFTVVIKTAFILLLMSWMRTTLTDANSWIFLDNVNLIFHEAGHALFLFFGDFLYVLGGSLLQCLIPVICLASLMIRTDWYGSGFCLFWLGENLVNVSRYIGDARAMRLELLGGDSSGHDWHYLLGQLGLLNLDTTLAHAVFLIGGATMVFSLLFMVAGLFLKRPKAATPADSLQA